MIDETIPSQAVAEDQGENARVAHLGPWERIRRYEMFLPALNQKVKGKVFLQPLLGLTGMEASFTRLPPGFSVPFYHRHGRNEELYVVISGEGQMKVDEAVFDLHPGTAVRVDPDGSRTLRNTGSQDLVYLCVQGVAGSMSPDMGTSDGVAVPDPVTWPTP